MSLQSGTISSKFSESHTIILKWSEEDISIPDNTSIIRWTLSMTVGQYGHLGSLSNRHWEVSIGGNVEDGYATLGVYANKSFNIASGSTAVRHNNDGTKKAKIGFSVGVNASRGEDEYFGTISNEKEVTLTVVPRASGLSVYDGTLGEEQNISADRKADGFTHTLTWVAGSQSGVIDRLSSATSWSFTPPMAVAEEVPSNTSVEMTFTLETYNNGTMVGSVTQTVTMELPSNIVPTVSFTLEDTTTCYAELGKYLQRKSRLHILTTAAGAYGSDIVSYRIEVDGTIYATEEVTTAPLQNEGTEAVTVTVTDSRSRTATSTVVIEIQSYNAPRITKLVVHRCDKDGTENQSGMFAKVTYSFSVSDASAGTVRLLYKKAQDSEYERISLPGGQSVENASVIFPADDGSPYDIELVIADSYGNASRKTKLSTGYTIMHFPASGRGVTFGGVATREGFNVNMTARFNWGLLYKPKVVNSGDCGGLLESGVYFIGNYGTDRPCNSVGWLEVLSINDGYFCIQRYTTPDCQCWIRYRIDDLWEDWKRVFAYNE